MCFLWNIANKLKSLIELLLLQSFVGSLFKDVPLILFTFGFVINSQTDLGLKIFLKVLPACKVFQRIFWLSHALQYREFDGLY